MCPESPFKTCAMPPWPNKGSIYLLQHSDLGQSPRHFPGSAGFGPWNQCHYKQHWLKTRVLISKQWRHCFVNTLWKLDLIQGYWIRSKSRLCTHHWLYQNFFLYKHNWSLREMGLYNGPLVYIGPPIPGSLWILKSADAGIHKGRGTGDLFGNCSWASRQCIQLHSLLRSLLRATRSHWNKLVCYIWETLNRYGLGGHRYSNPDAEPTEKDGPLWLQVISMRFGQQRMYNIKNILETGSLWNASKTISHWSFIKANLHFQ